MLSSQITSKYHRWNQRFVIRNLRWPVVSIHKWPVMWKVFPFYDVIIFCFQRLQLPIDGWPSHVVFDLRPYQEHIVYMVLSHRNNCHPFKDMAGGTLCQCDVRERKLLRQMSSVICVQCLREGKQLMVMQGNENTDYVYAVFVLDSGNFTPLLQFTNITPEGDGPLHKLSLQSHTTAFHSADVKAISLFTWDRKYKEGATVLTLTSRKTCLTSMTLREICLAIILQHLRVQDLGEIPLSEALKDFIRGYTPYCIYWPLSCWIYYKKHNRYHQTSNISRTLADNKIVDHSDVVGASLVGNAPTISSFST